jgi:hypothetical protein
MLLDECAGCQDHHHPQLVHRSLSGLVSVHASVSVTDVNVNAKLNSGLDLD